MFTSRWKNFALTSLHCSKSYQDSLKLLQDTQGSTKTIFGENWCNIYRRWVITTTIDLNSWDIGLLLFGSFLQSSVRSLFVSGLAKCIKENSFDPTNINAYTKALNRHGDFKKNISKSLYRIVLTDK